MVQKELPVKKECERKQGSGNSENFSLADFFAFKGPTLEARMQGFSDYHKLESDAGRVQYGRCIASQPGPVVDIEKPNGQTQTLYMFGSNDYLGFTHNPEIKQAVNKVVDAYGVGMGGPLF